ncbi:response regulator [Clostridium lacusfryxellense]|uniref:response regulator n=1 Tax=Clostridium lacusfryxellense TaxID=205328 RepID=UPI001C0E674D|nr:response regulator [Clostridium lacusfryxellense]MBU3111287.1 response regulator [Clostridium lacusfryxellense]
MFKLLIVDDEKIVIDAVSFIINKEFKEIIEAVSAKSGREAIEKCQSFNPDIVLMDIRMPGINGIDAINEIKKTQSNIVFIIVSAYEQFEYAKEAIGLGVNDYILKPIIKNNLVDTLENIIKRLNREREKRQLDLQNIENYQSLIPFVEHGFIYSILLGESYAAKAAKYKEILGISEPGGYIMILESSINETQADFNEMLEQGDEHRYYKMIRDTFKYKCKCLVGTLMINRMVVFISGNYTKEYEGRVKAYDIATYVVDKLKDYSNEFKLSIGIGSYKSIKNISSSYEEALRALHYKDKGITHIKDITVDVENITEYPKDQENRLIEMIMNTDEQGAFDAFNKIYIWVYKNYKNLHKDGKWKLMELMLNIDRVLFDFTSKDEDKNYFFNMNNIEDYFTLESLCRKRIIHVIKNIGEFQKKKINRVILNAKLYIDENFSDEITLEGVSKVVCVSPQYFSRLFKEETCQNFIEYLTKVRIDRAKQLMKSSSLSIKEICFKTGYTDPNYFSHIFKKTEKLTPSEYIKNCNKG